MSAVHPAAEFFPLMSDEEFSLLCDSMRRNGYDKRWPVLRYQGLTVDGRNRERAAAEVGVKVVYSDLLEESDPYWVSFGANLARRNLRPGQRAAITIKVLEASDAWAAEHGERMRKANEARAEKTREQHANPSGFSGRSQKRDRPSDNRTCTAIAKIAGVGKTTVEDMQKMRRTDPEAFEAVARGELRPRKKPTPRVDHKQRRSDVQRLHEQGLGTRQIARTLGLASTTVSKVKSDMGIAGTPEPEKLWSDVEHVVAILRGAQPQLDSLTEQLAKVRPDAPAKEIKKCINTLEAMSRSLRQLRTALSAASRPVAAQ